MRFLSISWVVMLAPAVLMAEDAKYDLQLKIDDAQGKSTPCRVHLYDAAGKPQQAAGLPYWRDHFVCDGRAKLSLAAGRYRYEVERGPEWQRLSGDINLTADRVLELKLKRVANVPEQGWYAGELHIHRPLKDIELLMRAEDLHIGPVITWWNTRNLWTETERPKSLLTRFDGNRFYDVMAGEDERGGGALLYFGLNEPLRITKASREFPASSQFADEARAVNKGTWIDIEKPFWWDLPLWLAGGQANSIGIANNHMCRSSVYATEAWGRARDEKRLPPPLGNGQWTQEIYYHILNCGLRLPPSAGSASGVLPNPVGYNRVYVHVDGELTYEKWWTGLKAGRCFVTNGPLLVCSANEQLPGTVFRSQRNGPLQFKLQATCFSQDPVKQIELVVDGKVADRGPIAPGERQHKTLEFAIKESGWFLIRAVTDVATTYRFASSGPFYVEIGDKPKRISKASVRFFQQWVDERMIRLDSAITDQEQREAVLSRWREARKFWLDLEAKATSD